MTIAEDTPSGLLQLMPVDGLEALPGPEQAAIRQILAIICAVAAPELVLLRDGPCLPDGLPAYHFLVVTQEPVRADHLLTDRVVNQVLHRTQRAVDCFIHDAGFVRKGLELGQCFFVDIVKDGRLLFDSGRVRLEVSETVDAATRREQAQAHFARWFVPGSELLVGAELFQSRGQNNLAAFLLHQAAEHFYAALLLVCWGYRPRTHSLSRLRSFARPCSAELHALFQKTGDPVEDRLFELLKGAYVGARYRNDFSIGAEELQALMDRLGRMRAIVERECRERLAG